MLEIFALQFPSILRIRFFLHKSHGLLHNNANANNLRTKQATDF